MADTIRLAVMGVTGAGKSTFIRVASGSSEVKIGHTLESCTSTIDHFEFQHDGRTIQLFDTPGFNDTHRSEAVVLRDIADWLDITYREPPHYKLNGIIYMQPITDRKMLGSSLRNLKMFRELCGSDPLKHVVLVTTGWGTAERSGDFEKALDNEQDLQSNPSFWQPMIKKGSRVMKFADSKESALHIIDAMTGLQPKALQIQTELVDDSKPLKDTAAGNTVGAEIIQLKKQFEEELRDAERKREIALKEHDEELAEIMRDEREKSKILVQQLEDDMKLLHYERRQEQRRYANDIEATKAYLRDKQEVEKLVGSHNMTFNSAVKRLEANSGKLRPETQQVLKEELKEQKKRPLADRTAVKLCLSLLPAIGSITLSLLGVNGVL